MVSSPLFFSYCNQLALLLTTFSDSLHCLLNSFFTITFGLPWWLRWFRICLQCGRPGFNPRVGKIPWRRAWQPTPVFLPGESPLIDGACRATAYKFAKELDTTEQLGTHTITFKVLHNLAPQTFGFHRLGKFQNKILAQTCSCIFSCQVRSFLKKSHQLPSFHLKEGILLFF